MDARQGLVAVPCLRGGRLFETHRFAMLLKDEVGDWWRRMQFRRYRNYSTGCDALPLAGKGLMLFLLRSGFMR